MIYISDNYFPSNPLICDGHTSFCKYYIYNSCPGKCSITYGVWSTNMLLGHFKIPAVIYCKMLLNVRCCLCDRWCHLVNKEFCGTVPE